MSIQAMKRALEALEGLRDLFYQETIDALRAAIEAAERQEPDYRHIEELEYRLRRQSEVHTAEKEALHLQIKHLTDPIIRQKMLEPSPPMFITTPQPAIPDGYALVPVEPTPKMVDATWDEPLGANESHNVRNKRIYKAMIAAAPKPVVPAWQPIETAPRDGTDVLIYTMAGSMYVAGYDDAFSNVWRIRNDEGVNSRVVTHWMPLPAAPKEMK